MTERMKECITVWDSKNENIRGPRKKVYGYVNDITTYMEECKDSDEDMLSIIILPKSKGQRYKGEIYTNIIQKDPFSQVYGSKLIACSHASNSLVICHFTTKKHSYNTATYEDIQLSLKEVREFINLNSEKYTKIHLVYPFLENSDNNDNLLDDHVLEKIMKVFSNTYREEHNLEVLLYGKK